MSREATGLEPPHPQEWLHAGASGEASGKDSLAARVEVSWNRGGAAASNTEVKRGGDNMRRYLAAGVWLLIGLAEACSGGEPAVAPAPPPAQTPRQRLQQAIDVSRELAGRDEEPDTPELKQAAAAMGPAEGSSGHAGVTRFALESHVAKYLETRPWSWHYALHVRELSATVPQNWPSPADAAALRDLLADREPAMRAMAAEALATLHQPEDVPRMARLLNDGNEAAPVLGHNRSRLATLPRAEAKHVGPAADRLDLLRGWRKETVAQSARRAIRLMTGQQFSEEAAFAAWWKVNDDGRNCLWYWQQRLERELDEADIAASPVRNPQRPGETWKQWWPRYQALRDAARGEVHKTIAAELRQLPAEVEAKVRLLAVSEHAGGAPITGSEGQFWPDPPALRVSPERLLDLLDRKDLWPDVPWGGDKGRGLYNLLAERLGMWAEVLFRPADVPRLRAAMRREHDNLWWSGQTGMILGISRLLPPAAPDKLDDPDTRDGALRQAVLGEHDLSTRGYCARELVRIGLPANAALLTQVSFAASKDDQDNRITQDILQALAEPPRTPEKRRFLIELLLDPRFEPFWTRPNTGMGMDMCRQYGIWAVNVCAGREMIDLYAMRERLVDPARSANALAEVRRLVAQLNQPAAQPDAGPEPHP